MKEENKIELAKIEGEMEEFSAFNYPTKTTINTLVKTWKERISAIIRDELVKDKNNKRST